MLTVRDVHGFLDGIAPFSSQMSFDNSGLMVGDLRDAVRHIGVCLDITPQTVELAAEEQIDLLVAHHPVLFKPRRQLLTSDPAYMLVRQGIAAICTHTCWDIAAGGVNDVLAKLFYLSRVEAVVLLLIFAVYIWSSFRRGDSPAADAPPQTGRAPVRRAAGSPARERSWDGSATDVAGARARQWLSTAPRNGRAEMSRTRRRPAQAAQEQASKD